MIIARTQAELAHGRQVVARDRALSLVPTMGALHDGHLALVHAAHVAGHDVAASIFVNPLQFEAGADLARYPVEHQRDLALLDEAGCSLVWLPTPDIIYPSGHATTIEVGGPALGFEGELRPGHFKGVATVVAILIGQLRPDTVWFGEKDWQQYQVVRRMIADLCLPVTARAVQTVRAPDGLALSSRNRFLTTQERTEAPHLHAQIKHAASRLIKGDSPSIVLGAARDALRATGFSVEYVDLVDGETLQPIETVSPNARIVAAARLGSVRLLDNIAVD
jgi:pantoate--beta-alanine ligase